MNRTNRDTGRGQRLARRTVIGLLLGLCGLATLASAAQAETLSYSNTSDTLTYTGSNQDNNVTFTKSGTTYTISDSTADSNLSTSGTGNPCTVTDATAPTVTATCSDPATGDNIDAFDVVLANGTDSALADSTVTDPMTLRGDNGDDTLRGSPLADTFIGGNGTADTVSYSDRTGCIVATLSNNLADDGADTDCNGTANENDTITGSDVENYVGGSGADTVTGNAVANVLTGNGGNDRFNGGDGGDTLDGGLGLDRALFPNDRTGTTGITVTLDNAANDTDDFGKTTENVRDSIESITGSPDNDNITGSCTANTIAPANGDDTVNGDPASCGTFGNDFMGGANCSPPAACTANGQDTFVGRGGTDRITYTANTATQGITVTLNDTKDDNDGFGVNNDNVFGDIEYVFGGDGNDTIDASAADQGVLIQSRLGNDNLIGSPFNDQIDGEGGDDTIDCGGGTNDMYVVRADDVPPPNPPVSNCEDPIFP